MRHPVAVWAGVSALFTNLAAVEILRLLGEEASHTAKVIAALATPVLVGASVYARQRLIDARAVDKETSRLEP